MSEKLTPNTERWSGFGQNAGLIEELYELYRRDPTLVSDTWADFFRSGSVPVGSNGSATNGHRNGVVTAPASTADLRATLTLQDKVTALVQAYRAFGHFRAKTSPLQNVKSLPTIPELDVAGYRFSDGDLATDVVCSGFRGSASLPLKELIRGLDYTYTGSVGFEFMHLIDPAARRWIQQRIESRGEYGAHFSVPQKKRFFDKLVDAEGLEAELHKKYVGAKRFSLQGGEALVPALDLLLEDSARRQVSEVVIGMSHRGRLNVLRNIVGKPIETIFSEFEDQSIAATVGAGDVKYHLGFSSTYTTPPQFEQPALAVKVSLAPNPSHLEFVDPVVVGMVRAKQDKYYNGDRKQVLPVLIHGDAAFIGQGVVFETLNIAEINGYATGGTLHIVVNNQVGFTTNPHESRSSPYCSDLGRGVSTPVFHVNGEDTEAACWVMRLALDFRLAFGRDVIIDLIGYRRYGHNEGDDPSFTQPLMYQEINKKSNPTQVYGEQLVREGIINEGEIKAAFASYAERFANAHRAKNILATGEACATHGLLRVPNPATGIPEARLRAIADTLVQFPEGFTIHPKLQKILEKRAESLDVEQGIDWGFGEGLAFGSLLSDGCSVRLSGQDCGRGTFSQRHLALTDNKTGATYLPFSKLPTKPGVQFEVYNSSLSESAILGFEFGYGTIAKNSLVIWEGQFGDFANGAQVHIDQFLASSEAKWNQLSGLVLMLPHGFEGQGPEHSSARLERYLQLCAEGNMVVCYPTRAAQHFHLLRRQGLMEIKRPLVIMTPKSLLRSSSASSSLPDFTTGQFENVLVDNFGAKPNRLVLCSGKVFYDLKQGFEQAKVSGAKVVRVEQLYPFPEPELAAVVEEMSQKKGALKECLWVQEEPQNMGAFSYIEPYLRRKLGLTVAYAGRAAAASPATGSAKHHALEQQQIVAEAVRWVAG